MVQAIDISESLNNSYIKYALHVISDRAIPNVEDGLKPVHRRILYAMYKLHCMHDQPYKKSARIVGDCLVAGSLVSTSKGLKPIEDIEIGDEVYTQKGLKKVTELFYQPHQELIKLIPEIKMFTNSVTKGHKFKILNKDLSYSFIEAENIYSTDYLIMQPSLMDMQDNYSEEETYSLGLSILDKIYKKDIMINNIDIENIMITFSNKNLLSFLNGLIDYENSTLNNDKNQIVIYATSINFLKKLSILFFDRFGIISKIDETYNDYYNLIFEYSNGYFFKDKLNLQDKEKKFILQKFQKIKKTFSYNYLPYFGKKISEIFSSYYVGDGWYKDENGEKFRLETQNNTKTRYIKELSKDINIYSDTIEELNILDKLKKLDSNLYQQIKYILDNKIKFIPISEIKSIEDDITYDFTVEDEHEFFVNGVVSSNCIGKYHPHGDTAVYDSLVRMAQYFSLRYPLIDGQGNFGSIDGDNPAAMRYTESRLTFLGDLFFKDINYNTVDFSFNYDDSLKEPELLPVTFPNILVNGTSGIAVGITSSIPQHNIKEICNATIALLENEKLDDKSLLNIIKGPDFPTGGIIFNKKGVEEFYLTGKGSFELEGKYQTNDDGIVIKEIPYQVNKTKLIETIQLLIKDNIIDAKEVKDLSEKQNIEIQIYTKKTINKDLIIQQLLKNTPLRTSFRCEMILLYNDKPKLMNLREVLEHFISFKKDVVIRRTFYLLKKIQDELHIIEGLILALQNIDEVVKIIKGSKNKKEAQENLIKKFTFSEIQAKAIISMQLGQLTSLEIKELEKKYKDLIKEEKYLNSIIKNKNKLISVIIDEIKEIIEKFGDYRKTKIGKDNDYIDIKSINKNIQENKEYILKINEDNLSKTIFNNKNQKGLICKQDDKIMVFFRDGLLQLLPITKVEEKEKKASVLSNHNEKVEYICLNSEKHIGVIDSEGKIKQCIIPISQKKTKFHKSFVQKFFLIQNIDVINIITNQKRIARFKLDEVPLVSKDAKGVIAIKLKDNEKIIDVLFNDQIKEIEFNDGKKEIDTSKYEIIKRTGRALNI